MQIKIKIVSLLPVLVAGLLLGGNVSADGGQAQIASFENVSAQIEQIRQKINEFSAELRQNQQIANVPVVKAEITQEKLSYIESEIKRITGESERIRIEVEIFLTLREIQRKTSAIAAQIADGYSAPLTVFTPPVIKNLPIAQTAEKAREEEIEAQIVKIKQQINELTQEMGIQAAVEKNQLTPNGVGSSDQENAVAPDDSSDGAKEITIIPAQEKTGTAESEQKGFWQSVGDFFKNIFTF